MQAPAVCGSRCQFQAPCKCLSARSAAKAASTAPTSRCPPRPPTSQRALSRCTRLHAADGANSLNVTSEARWMEQVRSGRVKNIDGRDVKSMLAAGWVLLDVRPPNEVEKVALEGAVAVPLFVPDPGSDFGSLLKKASAFGMGGWWLGGTHMIGNTQFLSQVQAQLPPDAQIIVGCQKGLRSLAACEQLSRAGYQTLAWVNGGFDATQPGELATVGGKDIRYAGIGGVSSLLGWSDVQQNDGSGLLGGPFGFIKFAAVILVLDLIAFGVEFLTAQSP